MFELLSKAIFLDVLVIYVFGLYLSNKGQPKGVLNGKLYSSRMDLLVEALAGLGQIIPLVYIFTPRLDFADYRLSSWFSWAGVLLFIVALWLLGKAHSALRHNFSPGMEIRDQQKLLSQGVYHYIRHPIYAGFWLWGIAQPLLLHNWIAGFAMLATFLPLYWVRVPREEKMLLGYFGEAYRKYMQETGMLFPRLGHVLQGGGMLKREKSRG